MKKLILILTITFTLGSCSEHCDSRGGCDHEAINRDIWQPVIDFTHGWVNDIRCQWNLYHQGC